MIYSFRWWKGAEQVGPKPHEIAKRMILISPAGGGTQTRPAARRENEGYLFCDLVAPGGNISRSNGVTWQDVTADLPM